MLGKQVAVLAQHEAAVVAMLVYSNAGVRQAAVQTLGTLDKAVLTQHAAAVVAMLEDSNADVGRAAVETLGKLDMATLVRWRHFLHVV